MTDKKYIAIIYEGEKTESQLLNNLNKNFFKDISELVPFMFPAGENIYMLWKQLKKFCKIIRETILWKSTCSLTMTDTRIIWGGWTEKRLTYWKKC